jgi:hypothetical protein
MDEKDIILHNNLMETQGPLNIPHTNNFMVPMYQGPRLNYPDPIVLPTIEDFILHDLLGGSSTCVYGSMDQYASPSLAAVSGQGSSSAMTTVQSQFVATGIGITIIELIYHQEA